LDAGLEARIAQRTRNVSFEPRRRFVRHYGLAGLEAPWSLCQRRGRSNPRGGNAGATRARKNNATKQRTAIEKPVAGNGINR
jgi:hypothetical protein